MGCRKLCSVRRLLLVMLNAESIHRVDEWLIHHMDDAPFHKLPPVQLFHHNARYQRPPWCTWQWFSTCHQSLSWTHLRMLSMNPYAPADTIAALSNVNLEVVFRVDNQRKISLDYARDYNVGGLVAMINGLCIHRHAAWEWTEKRKNWTIWLKYFLASPAFLFMLKDFLNLLKKNKWKVF